MSAVPGDIERCIRKVTPSPGKITTRKQVVRLIARLRRSEMRKTRCGIRLINLYNGYREVLGS